MKYIRTKDGIEAYNESCDIGYIFQCIGGINIADTIEELCDAFIYHYIKENRYEVYKELSNFPLVDREIIKDGNEIIGAIWTDKGLIYKAKMNDKGDWKLL